MQADEALISICVLQADEALEVRESRLRSELDAQKLQIEQLKLRASASYQKEAINHSRGTGP